MCFDNCITVLYLGNVSVSNILTASQSRFSLIFNVLARLLSRYLSRYLSLAMTHVSTLKHLNDVPVSSCLSLISKPRLHDTTCWQPVECLCTRYSRLSYRFDNRLYGFDNRFDNRLYRVYSRLSNRLSNGLYNPVWQPIERTVAVRSTRLWNRLYRVSKHPTTGSTTGLTTGLTTGWMFVYTIQPVVRQVVQPVWHAVVSCKRGINVLARFMLMTPLGKCLSRKDILTPSLEKLNVRAELKTFCYTVP